MTKIWRLIARFQYAGAELSGPTALDMELSAAAESLCRGEPLCYLLRVLRISTITTSMTATGNISSQRFGLA
jgi:hypothetical protein